MDPTAGDTIVVEQWKVDLKKYNEQTEAFTDFLANLYSVMIGQCTEALADKTKSHVDYARVNQNSIRLPQIIKQLTYSFKDRRKLSDALCEVMEGFYKLCLGEHESLQDYHERFKSHVALMDEVGGKFAGTSLVEK